MSAENQKTIINTAVTAVTAENQSTIKVKPNDLGYGPHKIKPVDSDPEGYGNMTGTLRCLMNIIKYMGSPQKVIDDLSEEKESWERNLEEKKGKIEILQKEESDLKGNIPQCFDLDLTEWSVQKLNKLTGELIQVRKELVEANSDLNWANQAFSKFLVEKEKKENEMLDYLKVQKIYIEGVKILDALQAGINQVTVDEVSRGLEELYAAEKQKVETSIAEILSQH